MEHLSFSLGRFHSICVNASCQSNAAAELALVREKAQWRTARMDGSSPPPPTWTPDSTKRQSGLQNEFSAPRSDKRKCIASSKYCVFTLRFVDDCGNGLSSHIEQLIQCLTIILQVTENVNYANEIIHMLPYLKWLWKKISQVSEHLEHICNKKCHFFCH